MLYLQNPFPTGPRFMFGWINVRWESWGTIFRILPTAYCLSKYWIDDNWVNFFMWPGAILLLTENQLILVNSKTNILEVSIIGILFVKKKKKISLFSSLFSSIVDLLDYCIMLFRQTFFEVCNLFEVQRKCHAPTSQFLIMQNIVWLILDKNTVDRKKTNLFTQ